MDYDKLYSEFKEGIITIDDFIEKSVPIIESSCKKYRKSDFYEDVKQSSYIGLIEAIDSFEPGMSKFLSYALLCIRRKISIFFYENNGITLSRGTMRVIFTLRNKGDCFSDEELIKMCNATRYEVECGRKNLEELVSINACVNNEGDKKADFDIKSDVCIEEQVENNHMVRQCINCLDEEERKVVILYYFDELSQSSIGYIIGKPQSFVFNVLRRSELKMRKYMDKEGFKEEYKGKLNLIDEAFCRLGLNKKDISNGSIYKKIKCMIKNNGSEINESIMAVMQ